MELDRLKVRLNGYAHVIKANIYNQLGWITYPYAAHFIPTWRCNLKCLMCNVWRIRRDGELSTKEMLKVIRQLKSLDVIKIVGGEPFLRSDLNILVNEIREKINPFIIQIITNGVFTDMILEFARSIGYEAIHFRISIDGLERTHDTMRGVEGTFNQAYSTLEGLVRLRERKKFVVGINFNVTDETLKDIDDIIKLCNDLRIDFFPGIPVTPFLEEASPNERTHRIMMLNNKEIFREKYKKNIVGKKKGVGLLERLFLKKTNNDIFTKLISKDINLKFNCRELKNLIYIHPNGDIVTCGLNHKKVGNLLEETLEEIWSGKAIRTFREEVDKCPGCLQAAVEILSRLYCWI